MWDFMWTVRTRGKKEREGKPKTVVLMDGRLTFLAASLVPLIRGGMGKRGRARFCKVAGAGIWGGGRVLASWRLPVKAFWTKDSRAQRYQATFWFHYTISPVMCTSHRLSVRYDEKYEDDKRHSSSLSPLPSAWLLSMLPCQDAVSPQP